MENNRLKTVNGEEMDNKCYFLYNTTSRMYMNFGDVEPGNAKIWNKLLEFNSKYNIWKQSDKMVQIVKERNYYIDKKMNYDISFIVPIFGDYVKRTEMEKNNKLEFDLRQSELEKLNNELSLKHKYLVSCHQELQKQKQEFLKYKENYELTRTQNFDVELADRDDDTDIDDMRILNNNESNELSESATFTSSDGNKFMGIQKEIKRLSGKSSKNNSNNEDINKISNRMKQIYDISNRINNIYDDGKDESDDNLLENSSDYYNDWSEDEYVSKSKTESKKANKKIDIKKNDKKVDKKIDKKVESKNTVKKKTKNEESSEESSDSESDELYEESNSSEESSEDSESSSEDEKFIKSSSKNNKTKEPVKNTKAKKK